MKEDIIAELVDFIEEYKICDLSSMQEKQLALKIYGYFIVSLKVFRDIMKNYQASDKECIKKASASTFTIIDDYICPFIKEGCRKKFHEILQKIDKEG